MKIDPPRTSPAQAPVPTQRTAAHAQQASTQQAPVQSPAPAHSVAESGRWLCLVVLSLAQLMVVLDATIVNIALPSAQAALGISDDQRQWMVTGYALAFGSLLLLGGRLSDFFGRRKMFVIGLTGFALASAVGGAAGGFEVLLIARIAQGAFGALLAPAALSLLSTTFSDPAERGKAFGIFGAISGAGGAVGLLLGGVLTEYASWRWCLYVNLAIAAIALLGAAFKLNAGAPAQRPELDVPGVITSVLGLVGVVYGLGNAESKGWADAWTIAPALLGSLLLVLFVLIERRSEHPLLPLRVVLDRNRGAAYLCVGVVGAGMFGVFLFLTYYLTSTLGFTPVQTGAAFLPMVGGVMISAMVSGSVLLPRFGPRSLVTLGALMGAGGLFWLTGIGLDSGYAADVLPGLIVTGLGVGLVFGPVQNAATSGVDAADSGVASAMVNTTQQIGGSIGVAILSSYSATAVSDYLTDHAGESAAAQDPALLANAALAGYHGVFWVSLAIFIAGAVLAALIFRSGPLEVDPDAEPVIAH